MRLDPGRVSASVFPGPGGGCTAAGLCCCWPRLAGLSTVASHNKTLIGPLSHPGKTSSTATTRSISMLATGKETFSAPSNVVWTLSVLCVWSPEKCSINMFSGSECWTANYDCGTAAQPDTNLIFCLVPPSIAACPGPVSLPACLSIHLPSSACATTSHKFGQGRNNPIQAVFLNSSDARQLSSKAWNKRPHKLPSPLLAPCSVLPLCRRFSPAVAPLILTEIRGNCQLSGPKPEAY